MEKEDATRSIIRGKYLVGVDLSAPTRSCEKTIPVWLSYGEGEMC